MKLYADEPGHEVVRALALMIVSALSRVEVPAAIWRKERTGGLTAVDAKLLVAAFEADYLGAGEDPGRLIPIAVAAPLLDEAAQGTAVHGLRAYDAIQLASAVAARRADPSCEQFACFDDDLRDAAARSGFSPLPSCC